VVNFSHRIHGPKVNMNEHLRLFATHLAPLTYFFSKIKKWHFIVVKLALFVQGTEENICMATQTTRTESIS
jgi:hypothetical protein